MTNQAKNCEWNEAIEACRQRIKTMEAGFVGDVLASTLLGLKRAPSHQAGQEGEPQFDDLVKQDLGPLLSRPRAIGDGPELQKMVDELINSLYRELKSSATRIETLKEALREAQRKLGTGELDNIAVLKKIDAALADGGK